MEISAKGKRVLITAGAAGIGRAMTDVFVQAGARVHICDVVQASIDDTLKAFPGTTATLADVSNPKDVERLFEDVKKHLGGLDCLINNAGIAGPTGKVEDLSIEEWERCIDIDVNGMFFCTRLAMPMIKAAGGGSIINLSSAAGRLPFPYRTPYSAAKWGVVGYTRSLSVEAGPDNVRVNAIQPGVVEGERINRVIDAKARATGISFEEQKALSLQGVSMHRMVSPYDIANMALYLASDVGRNITGQAISVCAGVEVLG
ncbi:MAG TPA: SDR family oxidoreductase [Burkholderiales bacterium]|jgi:NAD(P)-dependent dehydrogenase (short-subunit alcohol dehydrogenase family)|nr:SDR family oxidoreductase [Burkholderiales bacterium]